MIAYCFASGEIAFGPQLPADGALPLAEGEPHELLDFISTMSRHSYDGKTFLVPGIPEAGEDQYAALDALLRFSKWLAKTAPKGIKVFHSAHKPKRRKAKP
jgi:hypothetical protein